MTRDLNVEVEGQEPEPAEPKIKKRKGTAVPVLDEGETNETTKEHTRQLQKEMAKGSRNYQLIKQLMDLTYKYRRISIVDGLPGTESVSKILDIYPALQLVTEVSSNL